LERYIINGKTTETLEAILITSDMSTDFIYKTVYCISHGGHALEASYILQFSTDVLPPKIARSFHMISNSCGVKFKSLSAGSMSIELKYEIPTISSKIFLPKK
jgi:hypothetical protein